MKVMLYDYLKAPRYACINLLRSVMS
uniref:Uncharacterized protein n=1 Tax=Anguilla anguilla TaxID=7936 RepID=A0A0E9Q3W6_ANGAN